MVEKVDKYWIDSASLPQVNYYNKTNNNEIDYIVPYTFFSVGVLFSSVFLFAEGTDQRITLERTQLQFLCPESPFSETFLP